MTDETVSSPDGGHRAETQPAAIGMRLLLGATMCMAAGLVAYARLGKTFPLLVCVTLFGCAAIGVAATARRLQLGGLTSWAIGLPPWLGLLITSLLCIKVLASNIWPPTLGLMPLLLIGLFVLSVAAFAAFEGAYLTLSTILHLIGRPDPSPDANYKHRAVVALLCLTVGTATITANRNNVPLRMAFAASLSELESLRDGSSKHLPTSVPFISLSQCPNEPVDFSSGGWWTVDGVRRLNDGTLTMRTKFQTGLLVEYEYGFAFASEGLTPSLQKHAILWVPLGGGWFRYGLSRPW